MMCPHTFSFVSADETPANCTELLNCRGLKVFVDCYQVIAAEINNDCMLTKATCARFYSLSATANVAHDCMSGI